MSLDVYLEIENSEPAREAIYVRFEGRTQEISREVWDVLNPGIEPVAVKTSANEVFTANITHNLNRMAEAAGIYQHLWRPEEIGVTKAQQLIEPLEIGLKKLQDDPDEFKKHNPSNGWGTYEGLVAFVSEYLEACKKYPEATVSVSR